MQAQDEDIVAKRLSFSTRSPCNDMDPDCRPSKVRRTSPSDPSSESQPQSVTSKSVNHSKRLRVVDAFTNAYGFSPNEFLPIVGRKYRVPEALDPSIATTLHDDALGKCMFSGFLDSTEIIRLSEISTFFRQLASQHVTRLDFSRCQELQVEDVTSMVQRFPNLKDLNFDYCQQFGGNHLLALLPLAPTLERLSLRGCNIDDSHCCSFLDMMALQNNGYTRLQMLDLSAVDREGRQRIGDRTMKRIAIRCREMKCLRVGWCKNITDSGLAALVQSPCCANLQELDISLTGISDDSIPHIQQALCSIPSLLHLDLSATELTGAMLLAALARFRCAVPVALQEFRFQFMQDLTLNSLKEFLQCPTFPSLRHLDLNFSAVSNAATVHEEIQATVSTALERNVRVAVPLDI